MEAFMVLLEVPFFGIRKFHWNIWSLHSVGEIRSGLETALNFFEVVCYPKSVCRHSLYDKLSPILMKQVRKYVWFQKKQGSIIQIPRVKSVAYPNSVSTSPEKNN